MDRKRPGRLSGATDGVALTTFFKPKQNFLFLMRALKSTAKGILLAGGTGSRLAPMTDQISKQLLLVGDKPMIYYPLCALMQAGIREILIISTPAHLPDYRKLLGSGEALGIELAYAEQNQPEGLPQALTIGAAFTGQHPVVLLLGDNIFWGGTFTVRLAAAAAETTGATLFAIEYPLADQYGVVEFDTEGQILSLEEKPSVPKSAWVITGAYVFDPQVAEFARMLKPSKRGETEIIDLLECYHTQGLLRAERLEPDTHWFDAGTRETLCAASSAVADARQTGDSLGAPYQIAQAKGWI
jgi:glucose-1-phosphate thymidylyltransferase